MSISKEQAREWAKYFIDRVNDEYEYSDIYEETDFTEEFPEEVDWQSVHVEMLNATIEVSWND